MPKLNFVMAILAGLLVTVLIYAFGVKMSGSDKYIGLGVEVQCSYIKQSKFHRDVDIHINDHITVFRSSHGVYVERCGNQWSLFKKGAVQNAADLRNVVKFKVLARMWQFYANWLIYSLPFLGLAYYDWRKHAHTGH